jgi:transcriptional regulator with XRE-family HTH domain
MGGPGSGLKPNVVLRQRVLRLRARGLTLNQVAGAVGVTRQTVWNHLRAADACKRVVRCAECRREVGPPLSQPGRTPAYCPDCLARRPDAPFGVRLKSCRVAAGLTVTALAEGAGVCVDHLRELEGGRRQPLVGLLCRLARVLGPRIYSPGPAAPVARPGPDGPRRPWIISPRCRDCGADLSPGRPHAWSNGPAYCLACLARHPEASFGQRLKAHRLAPGLSMAALACLCGMKYQQVGDYESGRVAEPKWRALVPLVAVLGHGLFPPTAEVRERSH